MNKTTYQKEYRKKMTDEQKQKDYQKKYRENMTDKQKQKYQKEYRKKTR